MAVWGGLAVVAAVIVALYLTAQSKRNRLPVYFTLPAFSLTNQNGQTMTLDDFRGSVWVADAIFTRCPGQCLLMSEHMRQIQEALPSGQPIRLVSFTTDPAFDTPPMLKKYAARFNAQDDRWTFLTGSKEAMHNVEVDGLKLAVVDKPPGDRASDNDLFIHSEKFVLLDKQGRVRAYFDGETSNAVTEVVAAAQTLE